MTTETALDIITCIFAIWLVMFAWAMNAFWRWIDGVKDDGY
jgi:hypothetical protein